MLQNQDNWSQELSVRFVTKWAAVTQRYCSTRRSGGYHGEKSLVRVFTQRSGVDYPIWHSSGLCNAVLLRQCSAVLHRVVWRILTDIWENITASITTLMMEAVISARHPIFILISVRTSNFTKIKQTYHSNVGLSQLPLHVKKKSDAK
jgi:hypothetical protein